MLDARSTPLCANSDSTATSVPASDPVCDAAARAPAAVRPDLTASTGFLRVTRRQICRKRSGLPKLSRYIRMTRVCASSSQHSSRSLPETSALLPRDTNIDRPRPRSPSIARIASPRAPDCEENATLPATGSLAEKEACSRTAGSMFMIPMQLGPTIRILNFLARSTTSRSIAAPAAPVSLKPAVMMTIDCTPLRPQDSTAPSTAGRGTAITARSIGSGMASTDG